MGCRECKYLEGTYKYGDYYCNRYQKIVPKSQNWAHPGIPLQLWECREFWEKYWAQKNHSRFA